MSTGGDLRVHVSGPGSPCGNTARVALLRGQQHPLKLPLLPSEMPSLWLSTSPWMLPTACPEPYPLLILPGDSTQAGVELQVLLGCQLIKERIELGAVAQALLDLQELLQDAVGEDEGVVGRRNSFCEDCC